jgi:hypothetical protein
MEQVPPIMITQIDRSYTLNYMLLSGKIEKLKAQKVVISKEITEKQN